MSIAAGMDDEHTGGDTVYIWVWDMITSKKVEKSCNKP